MMNLFNAVPDCAVWLFIGAISTTDAFLFGFVLKACVAMIRDCLADDNDTEE